MVECLKPSHLGHFDSGTRIDGREEGRRRLPVFCVASRAGRVATGALDGSIRIWDAEDLKLLSSMKQHGGAVLSLDWHPSKDLLVSGSDDCSLILWALDQENRTDDLANPLFTGSAGPQRWSARQRIPAAHGSDVTGVVWNAGGTLLASCGLDNAIVIWKFEVGLVLERRLADLHRGFVKGLSWSPDGQHLATLSDDRSLVICNPQTGMVVSKYTAPFHSSPQSCFFRRPSWSPDGLQVVAPGATNGGLPCCVLLSIGRTTGGLSFMGHATPTEVACFAPSLFGGKALIAIGSQDGTLSLWVEDQPKPVLVLEGLFEHSLLDLSWHGSKLFSVSYDGGIAVLDLGSRWLGPTSSVQAQALKPEPIVHNLKELKAVNVVTLKDGKKRIAPMLVQATNSSQTVRAPLVLQPVNGIAKHPEAGTIFTRHKEPRAHVIPLEAPFLYQSGDIRAEVKGKSLTLGLKERFLWKEHFPSQPRIAFSPNSDILHIACDSRLSVCSVWTGRRLDLDQLLDSSIVYLDDKHAVTEDAVLYTLHNSSAYPIPLQHDASLLSIQGDTFHFSEGLRLRFDGARWFDCNGLALTEYHNLVDYQQIPFISRSDDFQTLSYLEGNLSHALRTRGGIQDLNLLGAYARRCTDTERLREMLDALSGYPIELDFFKNSLSEQVKLELLQ